MFAVCCRVKKENKVETKEFLEKNSEIEYNSLKKNFNINDLLSKNEDFWEDEADGGA